MMLAHSRYPFSLWRSGFAYLACRASHRSLFRQHSFAADEENSGWPEQCQIFFKQGARARGAEVLGNFAIESPAVGSRLCYIAPNRRKAPMLQPIFDTMQKPV